MWRISLWAVELPLQSDRWPIDRIITQQSFVEREIRNWTKFLLLKLCVFVFAPNWNKQAKVLQTAISLRDARTRLNRCCNKAQKGANDNSNNRVIVCAVASLENTVAFAESAFTASQPSARMQIAVQTLRRTKTTEIIAEKPALMTHIRARSCTTHSIEICKSFNDALGNLVARCNINGH